MAPWSELTLAVALVAAAASPALLSTASDVWDASASDRVTEGVAAQTTADQAGVEVKMEVVFSGSDDFLAARDLVRSRLSRIDALAEPASTFFTLAGPVSSEVDRSIIKTARLVARPGAAEAVTILEHDSSYSDGVLISSWFAEQTGSEVGSTIIFGSQALHDSSEDTDNAPGTDVTATFHVSGIYEPLWSPQELDLPDYWDDVDPALIPRYLGAFQAPGFALMIMDQSTLAASGVPGWALWKAPIETMPVTYDAVRHLGAQYRSLEASFVSDASLSAAVADLAGLAPRGVQVDTGLFESLDVIEDAIAQLDEPLALVRSVGVIVGLLVMGAVGVFMVDRRRTEYRLLSGEGERWWRISRRVAAQLAAPVAAGTAVGAVLGVLIARMFGPADALEWGSLRVGSLVLFALAALAIASVVVGIAAERTLELEKQRSAGSLIPMVTAGAIAATVFLWSQVSQTGSISAEGVDPAVIALPVVGLVAVILSTVVVLRRIVSLLLRRRSRYPVSVLFALRRTVAGDRAMHLVSVALGFGVGMVVFALLLVNTLDRTIDLKLATEIGGETRLDLFGPVDAQLELPDGSTLLMVQDTRLTPGQLRVRVVAIDAGSFEDGVEWPEEFGLSAREVVRLLGSDTEQGVAAVAINGDPVPSAAAFGTTNPFPFEVVGRVESLPLASEVGSTIIVDGSRLNDFELERVAEVLGSPVDDPVVLSRYQQPTDRFRRHLITDQPREIIQPVVEAAGMGIRSESTRDIRAADADTVAARAVFRFLALLGYVASAVAVSALMLHLSARRRSSALASVMMRRMGLRRRRAARITLVEIATLTVSVSTTVVLAAFVLTRHVAGRFDPAPRLPPEVEVGFPYVWGLVVVAGAALVTSTLGYLVESSALRRNDARAVRDGA